MSIDPKDCVIVALDFATIDDAKRLLDELCPLIRFYKVGLELITATGTGIIKEITSRGGHVFYDCKFHDIPNTVAGAAKSVTRLGVQMFNVHALGGVEMMSSAVIASREEAVKINIQSPKVLAVSILTSVSDEIMNNDLLIPGDVQLQVLHLAKLAVAAKVDGIIASPLEIKVVREQVSKDVMIVTPGVRPIWAEKNDQKRTMTPAEAIRCGATYLVIGRPITVPPNSIGRPIDAANRILDEIACVK